MRIVSGEKTLQHSAEWVPPYRSNVCPRPVPTHFTVDTMIDDTRDGVPIADDDNPQKFFAEIVDLVQLRTDRNYAYNWARDLKLLTFDSLENPDRAAQIRHANLCAGCAQSDEPIDPKQPLQRRDGAWMCNNCMQGPYFLGDRYHCPHCDGGDYDLCSACVSQGIHCKDASHTLLYAPEVCRHLAANTCQGCKYSPLFPAAGPTQNFRIVRQSELPKAKTQCTHFVAVSYCWPHDEAGAQRGYRVRDESGKVRLNRAPDAVLDRAVAFAREHGYRFIWIDQECIDQDSPEEQSLAIQSMDLVYDKADLSIGLLDSAPLSDGQVTSLSLLYEWGQHRAKGDEVSPALGEQIWSFSPDILALLVCIASERWTSRAWVLQEAFSAGPKMVLLFDAGNTAQGELGVTGATAQFAGRVAVHMDYINSCVSWAKEFYSQYDIGLFDDYEPAMKFMDQHKTQLDDALDTLHSKFIRNRDEDPSTSQIGYEHPDGLGDTKSAWTRLGLIQRSCSAAMALTYLRHRDNSVISDRLSILANLCNYEYRIHTASVERTGYPLSSAIMALALLNADYSLILPEVYGEPAPKSEGQTPSWLLGSRSQLQKVEYFLQNPPVLYAPQVVHHYGCTQNGLSFAGYLWQIDKRLDLASLQTRYAGEWFVGSFILALRKLEPSAQFDAFLEPWIGVLEGLPPGSQEYLASFKANMQSLSHLPQDAWDKVFPHATRRMEEILQGLQYSVTIDLLDLLRDRREFGIADAVWNSVQGDTWMLDDHFKENDDVPTSVRELVDYDYKAWRLDPRFSLDGWPFAFDVGRDGRYLQSWLVDRIMREGSLWYGGLHTAENSDTQLVDSSLDEMGLLSLEQTEQASRASPGGTSAERRDSEAGGEQQVEVDSEKQKRGRLAQQQVISMMTYKAHQVMRAAGAKPDRHVTVDDPGSYLLLIKLSNQDEAEQHRIDAERRAIFDVNQPSLVVTPYNTNMEVLPRPETRSMSTSWTVEHAESTGDATAGNEAMHPIMETLRAKSNVRGIWAAGTHPITRYRLV